MAPAITALPGDLLLTVDGQPLSLRFSLRTLHNYTTAAGVKVAELGQVLSDDLYGAVGGILAAAVRCATGQGYTTDQALGLLETLPEAEQEAVSAAVIAAVRIDQSPVFRPLLRLSAGAQHPATNGASTDASPSPTSA